MDVFCSFHFSTIFILNIKQGAVNFALMMSQMEGGCPVDYNTITDLFLQVCNSFFVAILIIHIRVVQAFKKRLTALNGKVNS
jgi:hypothetical protein